MATIILSIWKMRMEKNFRDFKGSPIKIFTRIEIVTRVCGKRMLCNNISFGHEVNGHDVHPLNEAYGQTLIPKNNQVLPILPIHTDSKKR